MYLELDHLKKHFDGREVVRDLSLTLEQGQLLCILGASGCGKTTTLNMIGGFLEPDSGSVRLDGQDITRIPPEQRPVTTVFQSYGLFPHMTVLQNVVYGLKVRGVKREQARQKGMRYLEMVGLADYASAYIQEISGGQQQRVALARAFVIEPGVLLMDEPLSNLDAKLRVQMRTVIKKLQRRLGITTIYVTHDQEEALAISDRIAVIKEGEVMQVGSPENIYKKPQNTFVAGFIGVSNFVECDVNGENPAAAVLDIKGECTITCSLKAPFKGKGIISARPEQLFFDEKEGLPGKIVISTFLGDFIEYEIELDNGQTVQLNEYTKDVRELRPDGQRVKVNFDINAVGVYDAGTQEVISW